MEHYHPLLVSDRTHKRKTTWVAAAIQRPSNKYLWFLKYDTPYETHLEISWFPQKMGEENAGFKFRAHPSSESRDNLWDEFQKENVGAKLNACAVQ
eukprot:scaffold42991_cov59-Attheya_sp.AAC.3